RPPGDRPGGLSYWAWIAAALAVVLGGATWKATRPAALRPLVRMNVEIAPDAPLDSFQNQGIFALSPAGARLPVILRSPDGRVRLYTRLLDHNQPTALAGTENAGTPFFSPDGEWIGFTADGKLKKISVQGGAAVTLCDAAQVRGASWGDDGNI